MAEPPRTADQFRPTILEQCDQITQAPKPISALHISLMPEFCNFSPEELRLADYMAGSTVSHDKHPHGLAVINNEKLVVPAGDYSLRALDSHEPCTRYGGAIIKFQVGLETPREFAIHEHIASQTSEFVRLALKNEWIEAKKREITLKEDEPDIFEIYQIWAYRSLADGPSSHLCVEPDIDTYQKLVRAYILGEKLVAKKFQFAIIWRIIARLRATSHFDLGLTNMIYIHTPPHSPLRRLLRDIYLYCADASWLDEASLEEPVNGDFLRDLASDQIKLRQGALPQDAPFLEFTMIRPRYGTIQTAAKYLGDC